MRKLALVAATAFALPLWAQEAQQPAPADSTTPAPAEGAAPAEGTAPAPADGATAPAEGTAPAEAPAAADTPAPAEDAAPADAPAAAETAPEPTPTVDTPAAPPPSEEAQAAEVAVDNAGHEAAATDAAHAEPHIEDVAFPWEGPFGAYDQAQLQRGLQVFTEVCAGCHGLKYVPLRQLEDLGYDSAQVRAYAAQFDIDDPETGETRSRTPADNFPENTSAGAPDLSLMAKARAGFHGPYGLGINQLFKGIGVAEYITNILTGYTGEEKEEAGTTFYGNAAFSTGWIAMVPPLEDGRVEYADGHANDLHHLAEDVSAFLMWAAEPHMMARKQVGLTAVLFLGLLSVLLYLTNKRLWAVHKGKKTA
jgi:ubiquinol-cytochrome c reductase cytochrome c1 subunit